MQHNIPGFNYTAAHMKKVFEKDGRNWPISLSIGERTYGTPSIIMGRTGAKITIGNYCSIANDAQINIYPEHRMDWITTYPFVRLKNEWPSVAHMSILESVPFRGNITIGNDVWIGSSALILGGATIGDGAVIGAHAVVAKDVAPYSVVVGNPAREIRKRYSNDDIALLLEMRWWNWPEDKIMEYLPIICSGDENNVKNLYNMWLLTSS